MYGDIVVEIDRQAGKKPFLGGFRHKLTGQEFHHAAAQTFQQMRAPLTVERFTRDAQVINIHLHMQPSELRYIFVSNNCCVLT